MISAVVLTKNEEKSIIPCLKSLLWCDEVIIIDDYSTDKTVEKSQISNLKSQNQNLKLKIYKRHLNGDFAGQRNFALQQARGEWVLFLDADERISPVLRAEITNYAFRRNPAKRELRITNYDAFYLKRRDFFGGRWLKHGEIANVKLLRFARKNAGRWKRQVHEIWEVKGKIGAMKAPILHYPHPTISEFLKQVDFYSTLHSEALLKEGIRPSWGRIIFNPFGKFLQNYILRLGFLDGVPGLIIALMMSFHSFLAQSKLYLEWKK